MAQSFYVPPTGKDKLSNAQYAMTLEEISQVFGCTRERIRQIEKSALSKLRRFHMPELLQMRAMANEMRSNSGNGEYGVIR